MKGREWYQAEPVAEAYEDKRFTGGGRLIDRREKEAVLESLQPLEDRNVLEIACGTGRFTVLLAEHGAKVTGIDISDAMLAHGREKARRAAVADRLNFLRGDAARLPFPDNAFDAVFAIRFFHLADDPVKFLTEMQRVAKETIMFDTFNDRSARTLYNWALPMGSRLYSRQDIDHLLEATDLTLVSDSHDFVVPYGLYRSLPGPIARPLRSLDRTVQKTPVGQLLTSVSYWECSTENSP